MNFGKVMSDTESVLKALAIHVGANPSDVNAGDTYVKVLASYNSLVFTMHEYGLRSSEETT